MILKITNKDENFYKYMGKFFGSRTIEKQINDRIYDDDNKEWYIYLKEDKVLAFVSISKNVRNNIYTTKEEYLEELLKKIKKENIITYSIVNKNYMEIYEKCGFKIKEEGGYKNFIMIYLDEKGIIASKPERKK